MNMTLSTQSILTDFSRFNFYLNGKNQTKYDFKGLKVWYSIFEYNGIMDNFKFDPNDPVRLTHLDRSFVNYDDITQVPQRNYFKVCETIPRMRYDHYMLIATQT